MSQPVVSGPPAPVDPLATLREYRPLAPWGLRDLAALAGAILDASGVVPINAAARAHPTERTIRFYVARGLVSPPEGRGTAAVYTYKHLLQVLAIKLRQMEGATLETIVREAESLSGDMIERRVAQTLGPALPRPSQLALLQAPGTGRGRVGRALQAWIAAPDSSAAARGALCRRVVVAPGVELLIDDQHPIARLHGGSEAIGEAVRRALATLMPPGTTP
ncbi:MAG TPA: MerR family transcriptional regulator [Gemmatimonadales bacterium]|nr:MerR family transcriptional regulator [Gemmatimonadales bacterium]